MRPDVCAPTSCRRPTATAWLDTVPLRELKKGFPPPGGGLPSNGMGPNTSNAAPAVRRPARVIQNWLHWLPCQSLLNRIDSVHVDLYGPLKLWDNNKHVLCMTNAFSKIAVVMPIPDMEASTVAQMILNRWIYRFLRKFIWTAAKNWSTSYWPSSSTFWISSIPKQHLPTRNSTLRSRTSIARSRTTSACTCMITPWTGRSSYRPWNSPTTCATNLPLALHRSNSCMGSLAIQQVFNQKLIWTPNICSPT